MTNAPAPNRWLKMLTRKLIKACGGLEEASTACEAECRPYSVSHLHRATKVDYPAAYLPVDIVLCLEAYCGEPIITRAMAEKRPSVVAVGDLRDEISDVTERAAAIQAHARAALADGKIDARERAELEAAFDAAEREMAEARAALAALSPGGAS